MIKYSQMKKGKEIFLFLIVFFLGLILIVYKIDQIPKNLALDEVKYALLALSLNKKTYIPFSPLVDGHPTLYFYIILASFKLFGISTAALRLPSAFFGLIDVTLLYLILKIVFKNKELLKIPYSFLLTIIFITLHWRLNFNRFSFDASFLLLNELFSILFLILGIKNNKAKYFMLTGLFSGLAFNSYQPGRIFFLAPLAFMLIKKIKPAHILIFLIPLNLLAFPVTSYLVTHPAEDVRVNELFYPVNNRITILTKGEIFTENIFRITNMFLFKGDPNGRHNFPYKPAFNLILSSLFFLGLVYSFFKLNKDYNLMFILIFAIGIAPSLIVYSGDNPSMLRTFGTLSSVIYFIGNGINLIFSKKFIVRKKVFTYLFLILITISCLYELRTYFVYQPLSFENAFIMKRDLYGEIQSMRNTERSEYRDINIKL